MNGILLLDKPEGWTSHDCVAKLRGILRERRIGHAGTLDPLATGLLVVFAGRATRAAEFAQAQDKEYIAGLRPGIVTDTQDITGNILSEGGRVPDTGELRRVLEAFCGELEQLPPMYSAVKINGQRLYAMALRGETAARPARRINVESIELTGREEPDFILKIRCSKGTYIRTLCHDIGAALGCGAAMSSLRRVQSGDFSVGGAHTLGEIERAAKDGGLRELLRPVDSLFAGYPSVELSAQDEKRCRNGAGFNTDSADGVFRIYGAGGVFLALGQVRDGKAVVIKSFFEV